MSERYQDMGSGKIRTPDEQPSKPPKPPKPEKSRKGGGKAALIVLIVLLLAALAYTVYLLLGERPFATYSGEANEATLTETQAALADMTAEQETTAAKLAATEATLAETQSALADMTAERETTAATLAATEATLAETQTALDEMTATLAATEATLAETQSALADMTAEQETTAATLAATEATLAETQSALADLIAKHDATVAELATTEALLAEATLRSVENILQENKNASEDEKNTTLSCPIAIISQKSTGTEYGYSHASFTVKNVSGETIHTLTLDIKILDENKTVLSTTHPQEGVRIADGESITIEALAEEGAYSMKLDGYSYYTGVDFDGDYVQGFFSSTEEVVLD